MLSLLYGPTLTSIHDYRKNRSFDYMDLYTLLRFVIAFSSKEQASFNFMAAVTICSDFGKFEEIWGLKWPSRFFMRHHQGTPLLGFLDKSSEALLPLYPVLYPPHLSSLQVSPRSSSFPAAWPPRTLGCGTWAKAHLNGSALASSASQWLHFL